jgi:hypothetical protein
MTLSLFLLFAQQFETLLKALDLLRFFCGAVRMPSLSQREMNRSHSPRALQPIVAPHPSCRLSRAQTIRDPSAYALLK